MGMMCIKRREEPLTIGFCQANKNRNVIAVSEDTDQSSPPSSLTGCLSLSRLAPTGFDDLKGRGVSSIIQISQSLISVRDSSTPPSRRRWPCQRRQECTETFMLDYFYFKEFPPFFPLSLYVWRNSIEIHLDESLINWNKISGCRSLQTLSCHVKLFLCVCFVHVDFTGRIRGGKGRKGAEKQSTQPWDWNILFFYLILASCRAAGTHADGTDGASRLRHCAALCNYAQVWLVVPCRSDVELISPITLLDSDTKHSAHEGGIFLNI